MSCGLAGTPDKARTHIYNRSASRWTKFGIGFFHLTFTVTGNTTTTSCPHRRGAHLEDGAVVEVVGAGPALQRGEGHVPAGERRDVAEVVGAVRLLLVLAGADEAAARLLVGLLAGAAVVLVGHPGAALAGPLVDGEALRAAGVELEADVGDVEGFTCREEDTSVFHTL